MGVYHNMTPIWHTRRLVGGEEGTDVTIVNRKLGVTDRTYGEASQQFVRGLQIARGMEPTGEVDADTAMVLGEAADHHLPPEWFRRPLGLGDRGEDVAALRGRLNVEGGPHFDTELERAVRRFQSSKGLEPTGKLTEALALLLP